MFEKSKHFLFTYFCFLSQIAIKVSIFVSNFGSPLKHYPRKTRISPLRMLQHLTVVERETAAVVPLGKFTTVLQRCQAVSNCSIG